MADLQVVIARCDDCGKLQAPEMRRPGETAFPVRCVRCDDPTEGAFAVSVTALVAIAVAKSNDGREWRVRTLGEDEIQRVRAVSHWIATAQCRTCARTYEGYEAAFAGVSETHLPARCPTCEAATEAITLEPAIVSRSHDDEEWYVVVLEDDEIEQVRHGVSLSGSGWPS